MKNQRGFTLIELMVAIAVIAILASIASVKAGQQLSKARDGKALAIVGSWRTANYLVYADTSNYVINFGDLQDKVDNQTISLTYGTSTESAFSGATTQWTRAGKSDNVNNMVSFTITGSSIESSIIFDSINGKNSNNREWDTY